jgi:hypothetical protein
MGIITINSSLDPANHPLPKEEKDMASYKRFVHDQARLLPVSFHIADAGKYK